MSEKNWYLMEFSIEQVANFVLWGRKRCTFVISSFLQIIIRFLKKNNVSETMPFLPNHFMVMTCYSDERLESSDLIP